MTRKTLKHSVKFGTVWSATALIVAAALAQDVPGIEICTRESRLDRRTSCLQSNVEFLQQVVTRNALDAQQKLAAANREIAALKEQSTAAAREVAALKDALAAMEAKIGEFLKVDGNTLTVKSREGATVKVVLKDNALVTGVDKAMLSDI